MTIEIKRPELEALIQEHLQSGVFQDVDELLTMALGALDRRRPPVREPRQNLADFLLKSPFASANLDLERRKEYVRPSDL